MEITATEIERQATRVEEEVAIFYKSCNRVIEYLDSISRIVKSDDSDLSRKINGYVNTYINMQNSIKNKFSNLAQTMHSYASKTIKNEETTQEGVQISDVNLSNIDTGSVSSNVTATTEATNVNSTNTSSTIQTSGTINIPAQDPNQQAPNIYTSFD